MNETALKVKVLKYIRDTYPTWWVYKTSDRFKSGVPDLLICGDSGHLIAIELKIPGEDATPLQRYKLNAINTAGGSATVCHSLKEVAEFLRFCLTKKSIGGSL